MTSKKEITIKTFLGELKITALREDSTGYYAITGKDLTRRTWTLSKDHYEKLCREWGISK